MILRLLRDWKKDMIKWKRNPRALTKKTMGSLVMNIQFSWWWRKRWLFPNCKNKVNKCVVKWTISIVLKNRWIRNPTPISPNFCLETITTQTPRWKQRQIAMLVISLCSHHPFFPKNSLFITDIARPKEWMTNIRKKKLKWNWKSLTKEK